MERLVRRTGVEDYEGVDLEQAQRMGSLLELVGLIAGGIMLAAAPPTVALGSGGWVVVAVIAVVALAGSATARITDDYGVGLAMAYLAVAQVSVLEWLAGGLDTPYAVLYVLPLAYVAGVHPAPRLAVFLLVLCAAAALPLAYDGGGIREVVTVVGEAAFFVGLGVVVHQLMHRVRVGRLELTREGDEARRLARLDSLTGLGNRRAFEEALEREVARSHRHRAPLAMLVADLDGFKEINDRYGHAAGDECLRAAGAALDEEVRLPDLSFRWGGDEFTVLLPDADREAAAGVGERIAAAVSRSFPHAYGSGISLSFGVAELERGNTPQELVEEADRRLFESKREDSRTDTA